jgi:hypothetical protein
MSGMIEICFNINKEQTVNDAMAPKSIRQIGTFPD